MARTEPAVLLRRGLALEYATLAWNVVGVFVVGAAAVAARSVALAGFGLDSAIEIFASVIVVWELKGAADAERERRALRRIGAAFFTLAVSIAVQAGYVLVTGARPDHSPLGITWTAVTAAVMFALAAGKAATGTALDHRVLQTEGRVTLIDGYLAAAVLVGLVLNATAGWWWADPLAGMVIVVYGIKEGAAAWSSTGAPV